jgi:O-antigen ligase
VFLSGSRGGLIAIVVLIIAFALIYPPKIKNKIFVLLAGCCFVVCAWVLVAPFLPENIIERMSVESVIESGGTGRWYIWKSMLDEIINSPNELLLGRGIHAMHEIFLNGKWSMMVAHNQIIQVLYNQGLIGLIAFIVLTTGCFLRCIRKRKTVSVAIIGMMALSISLSFNQTTRTFWNLVAYAALNFSESEYNISEKTPKLPEED